MRTICKLEAMDEIIADIYHAAAGTKAWGVSLTRIVSTLGLRGAQMVGVNGDTGAITFSHASEQVPSESELEYVRTYHGVDPRIGPLLKSTVGNWLFDQDEFADALAVSNAYYRELLIPFGARYSASVKLLQGSGEVVLLAFLSDLGAEGFTPACREALQSISFHLREAAAIYQKTRRLTTSAMAGTEMLHRMARPAMLIALDRSMNYMNKAAKRYIDEGDALLLAGDRLTALHRASDDQLAIAFQAITKDVNKELALGALGSAPQRRTLRLGRRQGPAEAVLSLTPFAPSQSMYAFGTQPLVLVVVHDHRTQIAPDIMLWEAAFNLTPALARVGLALFHGSTIAQAAAALQIAATTVKSHLKELYKKTETSGQVQLVAVLEALQG